MRVHKNSWHYRLWMLGRSRSSQPRDLCRYFWHLFLIKLLAPAIIAALALTGIGALLYLIWGHPMESGLVVCIAAVCVGAVITSVWAIGKLVDRHRTKQLMAPPKPRKPKVEKPPSVVWEFVKAKKRKACPLIEVIED